MESRRRARGAARCDRPTIEGAVAPRPRSVRIVPSAPSVKLPVPRIASPTWWASTSAASLSLTSRTRSTISRTGALVTAAISRPLPPAMPYVGSPTTSMPAATSAAANTCAAYSDGSSTRRELSGSRPWSTHSAVIGRDDVLHGVRGRPGRVEGRRREQRVVEAERHPLRGPAAAARRRSAGRASRCRRAPGRTGRPSSAGSDIRNGSPPPTSTTRPRPPVTTRVLNVRSGPSAWSAASPVRSLVVDAGIASPVPTRASERPVVRSSTAARTCGPRSASARYGASAASTFAGCARPAGGERTRPPAPSRGPAGRSRPGGGGTSAGLSAQRRRGGLVAEEVVVPRLDQVEPLGRDAGARPARGRAGQ